MTSMQSPPLMTVDAVSTPSELRIKGSRFIGQVFHIETRQEFEQLYRQARKMHARATHCCYAYRLSASLFHYYDDGEPNGTAGKPIFHVLDEQNLYEVLLIVVRYFGGTKLGRNGLVRAYSQSAQQALLQGGIIPKVFYRVFVMQLSYELVQDLVYLVKKNNGLIDQTDYQERVKIQARIAQDHIATFTAELNILAGKGSLIYELQ